MFTDAAFSSWTQTNSSWSCFLYNEIGALCQGSGRWECADVMYLIFSQSLSLPLSLSLSGLKTENPVDESGKILGDSRATTWKVHGSTRHGVG